MMRRRWVKQSSTYALQTPWLSVRKDAYIAPSGKEIPDFYVVERKDFVVVVAKTEDGQYILVSQYRHGIEKVIINFPMGFIEKGEAAEKAARRELKEETGYVCKDILYLGSYYIGPALQNTKFSVFAAANCIEKIASEIDPEIEGIELIGDAALATLVATQELDDAVTLLSYLLSKEMRDPGRADTHKLGTAA